MSVRAAAAAIYGDAEFRAVAEEQSGNGHVLCQTKMALMLAKMLARGKRAKLMESVPWPKQQRIQITV
jgi:hypothetical protein